MRRFLAAFVGVVVVLLVAACGHGHKQTVRGHRCDPANYAMQCAKVDKSRPRLNASAPAVAQGVDFAWGGPSCSTLRSQGRSFGASYLSFDGSKNWSHGQFNEYMAHGCSAVFVWETGANEATAGYGAGRSDAQNALAQYRSYVPNGRVVIYFAIDCDCSGGQVDSYFRGVDSILGAGQAGAYGGITPLNYLFGAHLIDWGWQTYAWSGGAWNGSQLEQYLNDGQVDYDRAIAADFGQVPAPGPPPDPYAIFTNVVYDLGHNIKAAEVPVVKGWNERHCLVPTRRPVCGFLHYRLNLLDGRLKAVANRSHPADWSTGHRFRRARYIEHELTMTKGPWTLP